MNPRDAVQIPSTGYDLVDILLVGGVTIAIVLFFAILGHVIIKKMLSRLEKYIAAQSTKRKLFASDVTGYLRLLLLVYIWSMAAHFCLTIVHEHSLEIIKETPQGTWVIWKMIQRISSPEWSMPLFRILQSVVLFISLRGLVLSRKRYHDKHEGDGMDVAKRDAIAKVTILFVFIFAALDVLSVLGVSIKAILAFGGVGGVAVAFAAREWVSNFFGTIMIYMDNLFKIGDMININKEIEGKVEEIGWRVTKVRTLDKKLLYIPNARFNFSMVENLTRRTHRKFDEVISIRYSDLPHAEKIVGNIKKIYGEPQRSG